MSYRYDEDLEFLKQIDSKDLDDLVYVLTHDKDGETRFTEELTTNENYKKFFPEHNKYWEDIAAELQCYGGNTFATIFRGGKGVEYKEILIDVCDKLKVNFNKDSSIETIETNLLMKILTDAIEKMSPEELKEQDKLRKEYIKLFREGFKSQLKAIKVVDEKGNDITPLKLKQEKLKN